MLGTIVILLLVGVSFTQVCFSRICWFVVVTILTQFVNCFQARDVQVDVTHKVMFDVSSGGQQLGRITIGLFGNNVPRFVLMFDTISIFGHPDPGAIITITIFRIM